MKLFVIATFIAVAAAGRLEHLQNHYLPPHQPSYWSTINSQANHNVWASNTDAVSNKYLPPKYEPLKIVQQNPVWVNKPTTKVWYTTPPTVIPHYLPAKPSYIHKTPQQNFDVHTGYYY